MLVIGLMSGTSLDGIDCSLVETDGENSFYPIDNLYIPYTKEFQEKLRKLIDTHQNWFCLEKELTIQHANAVISLLQQSKFTAKDISIIGFHGQTIYSNPAEGIIWQIGNPHLLAEITGINVVSDFRRRDVAHGGQGAPLIPIFHQCLMNSETKPVAIINIGGVANITYIDDNLLLGFDTGPGNALINDAMLKYYDKPFDNNGEIAGQGLVNYLILNEILQDEFFLKQPPKSLDRNNFAKYSKLFKSHENPSDVIATLTKLTVESIKMSFEFLPKIPNKIYICGGGIKNTVMMTWLKENNRSTILSLSSVDSINLNVDFIESQGFAYIAARYLKNLPSSFQTTTAVNRETLSGVLFHL